MDTIQLEITREFSASVEELYEAWTHPEIMQKWFAPGAMKVAYVEVVLRVGGGYQIVMEGTDGNTHTVSGDYQVIEPNKQLIFSWQWQDSNDIMQVSLVFSELSSNKTKMTLLHTGLVTEDAKVKHNQGWDGCLEKLSSTLCE